MPRLRSPKFLNNDVSAYKVNSATIPIKQALSNIRDFKQNLLRGIFPLRATQYDDVEPVGFWVAENVSHGSSGLSNLPQSSGFLHFRPSLADPLRPGTRLVSSSPSSSSSTKFSSPSEFTSIDMAVGGEEGSQRPGAPAIIVTPYSGSISPSRGLQPLRLTGRLNIPKETTPIDVAVFQMPSEYVKRVNYNKLPTQQIQSTHKLKEENASYREVKLNLMYIQICIWHLAFDA